MGNELEVNHILTSTNERTRKERGKRKKRLTEPREEGRTLPKSEASAEASGDPLLPQAQPCLSLWV